MGNALIGRPAETLGQGDSAESLAKVFGLVGSLEAPVWPNGPVGFIHTPVREFGWPG